MAVCPVFRHIVLPLRALNLNRPVHDLCSPPLRLGVGARVDVERHGGVRVRPMKSLPQGIKIRPIFLLKMSNNPMMHLRLLVPNTIFEHAISVAGYNLEPLVFRNACR